MEQDNLRLQVKLLKATGAIRSYKELAELMELNYKSLLNWLSNQFEFGSEKKQLLEDIISTLSIAE